MFPQDYGNYAFNEAYLNAQNPDDVLPIFSASAIVVNPQAQYAMVYINRVMDSSGVLIGFNPGVLSYQVPFPSPYVQIFVQDPWGTSTVYAVLANSPPLAVGESFEPLDPAPEPDPVQTEPVPDKQSGGLDLLGGYDASANFYGGATYPYYDIRLSNE